MKNNNFLHINIMAHPKRKSYVAYLKRKLGKVTVIWENGGGIWDTRKRCMEDHIKAGAKWSLTLQDDCLLTDDFVNKAIKFIKYKAKPGSRIFSFNFYYWNRSSGTGLAALRRGFGWTQGMKSGLAICLDTTLLPAIIEMWDGREDYILHDDSRIGRFLRKRHLQTYYPCPSLVQHRDSESLIYTKEQLPKIRQALYYDDKKYKTRKVIKK